MEASLETLEEKVRLGYLYDFYGELLNPHQRQVYENYVLNDLSLSEIGEEEGISRQAAHDMISRCTKKLKEYESRLHLLEKFLSIRGKAERIRSLAGEFTGEKAAEILGLTEEIVNSL